MLPPGSDTADMGYSDLSFALAARVQWIRLIGRLNWADLP
jgi:hypothetical protein